MQTLPSAVQLRFRWVDLIRALGAFLVVLAHVEFSGSGPGVIRDFYYALTRAAVPLFFMVSGYLLISKDESHFQFFRKRMVKVFIPFLIWSLIYLLWQQEGFGASLLSIAKSYFVKILRGPRENHLWFFYELFGLYLFTPLLRVYARKAGPNDMFYFCGVWFLMMPVLKLIESFTPIQFGFSYQFLGGYVGYFLFGYFAGSMKFTDHQKHVAWIFFLEGLVLTVAGLNLSAHYGITNQYFEDYSSVNVAIMSCALFIALTDVSVSDSAYRFVAPLSSASFGIYLAHVIIMTQFFSTPPFSILPQVGSNIYMIPFLGLLGFGLTFLLIFILQKIPVIKNIVP
jgi:surface polysaccharide O-acyltransferase-like enzyme